MNISFQNSLDFARQMDQADPLKSYRENFHIPVQESGEPYIYFCGNSLGCQPKSVRAFIETELKDWEMLGVEGHFHAKNPWMPYHEFLTESSARIVGALPEEVVVMNSLTVNLHLMMASFYRPDAKRYKIMIEADAFPSDIYAVKSQLIHHGFDPEEGLIMLQPKEGEHCVWQEDIEAAIRENGDQLALILLGGVNYYTGQVFDFEKITKIGHEVGAKVGFDLAHAVGNIQLKLHDWNVDFACWCTYKYLNSGPGGVGGCFVHQRNASDKNLPRFAGWWGHDKETRFQMGPEFDPIPTAEGWQLSNAPVLAMASLKASLAIFDEVGMDGLVEKSKKLTGYLLFLLQDIGPEIEIITPSDPKQRGCQLSLLTGANGRETFERITKAGIICDWREPNVIRLAPVPLYNSFEDVWRFAEILKD
ncbi:MAG: kynureninase [Bacteroidetes bacterium]|nr:kynureninase [Bacteroidota bacterium]